MKTKLIKVSLTITESNAIREAYEFMTPWLNKDHDKTTTSALKRILKKVNK